MTFGRSLGCVGLTDDAYGLLMGLDRWLTLDEPSSGARPPVSWAESLGALAGDLSLFRGDTGGGSLGPPAPQYGAPPPTLRCPLLLMVSSILRRGGPSWTVGRGLVGMVLSRVGQRHKISCENRNGKRRADRNPRGRRGATPSRHRLVSINRGRRPRERHRDPWGHSDPCRTKGAGLVVVHQPDRASLTRAIDRDGGGGRWQSPR